MKKFIALLIVGLLLYIVALTAPVFLFLNHLASLPFSADMFEDQFDVSSFAITEGNPQPSASSTTVKIPEEILNARLQKMLTAHQDFLFSIEKINTNISPEIITLKVSADIRIFGFSVHHLILYSEWGLRLSSDKQKQLEVKLVNIHTNHLYSINWADMAHWRRKTECPDGWCALTNSSTLSFEEIALDDNQILLTAHF